VLNFVDLAGDVLVKKFVARPIGIGKDRESSRLISRDVLGWETQIPYFFITRATKAKGRV
jgi:hypothetical protein